ncbi:hypothetical protein BABINDRAFT_160855 [Babjeviella inositovora NRRL Y-12698]|uniref:Protein-tyrosine-phosphatase n=1 Tax=Babjeviella inositovora NRRL Y-12698 TaxID=984486 RepID=A0A1E3QSI0_9ASCO|nr:uncharacterized protein BABINDRAFT_160855 [Babjeviella inositovora NRRL Y-12698]ODQ80598.1 hypothetical protein BABINDRAFT_160855 [Babjeviella inositovora NRRL Y-12698]
MATSYTPTKLTSSPSASACEISSPTSLPKPTTSPFGSEKISQGLHGNIKSSSQMLPFMGSSCSPTIGSIHQLHNRSLLLETALPPRHGILANSPTFDSVEYRGKFEAVDSADLSPEIVDNTDTIFLDIRPYTTFVKSRIRKSLNLCIPTTLLKRASFRMRSILGSMTVPHQTIFLEHITQPVLHPLTIIVYDESSTSSFISLPLYNTILKIFNYVYHDEKVPEMNVTRPIRLKYVNGGIQPLLTMPGHPIIDAELIQKPKCTANLLEDATMLLSQNSPTSATAPGPLSGFSLPSSAPFASAFASSMKKNKPALPSPTHRTSTVAEMGPEKGRLGSLKIPEAFLGKKLSVLPPWLKEIVTAQRNSDRVLEKFVRIEQSETVRLETVVKQEYSQSHVSEVCSPSAPCPSCDNTTYALPKGIEFGFKNRYTNIWPYEHSRVVVLDSPKATSKAPGDNHLLPLGFQDTSISKISPSQTEDDYLNANYVYVPSTSSNHYIATQAPLPATFENFWRAIWHNNTEMIICLTDLKENGVKKSDNYWRSHHYEASGITVAEESVYEDDDVEGNVTVRKLKITKRNRSRHLYQLVFKDWPDFGVPPSAKNILKLVRLKDSLAKSHKKIGAPIVVHCSAGCGRTGTFITVDMVLQCFQTHSKSTNSTAVENSPTSVYTQSTGDSDDSSIDPLNGPSCPTCYKEFPVATPSAIADSGEQQLECEATSADNTLDAWGETDLIYKTVHSLRRQRISMVQSVSQYALCYEVVLQYLLDTNL